MSENYDEFDITKIPELRNLVKRWKKKTGLINVSLDKKSDKARGIFYKKNFKLYYKFNKAILNLDFVKNEKDNDEAMYKLKQLILLRQFLKPYKIRLIFSTIKFLRTENDELKRYRVRILELNPDLEDLLNNLEMHFGIDNLEESYSNSVSSIETSAGTPSSNNSEVFDFSSSASTSGRKRKRKATKTRGRKNKSSSIKTNSNRHGFNSRLAFPSDESPTSLGTKKKRKRKRNSSRKRKIAKKKV